MPRPRHEHGPAWMVQAATIAQQFYLGGRSKVEIADDLGISRFKVARILEEAVASGLVEVTVRLPAAIDAEASTVLTRELGVRVIVCADGAARAGRHDPRAEVATLAADLLDELVTADDVLGLSCSRTVNAATEQLAGLAPCDVVQLTGTMVGQGSGGDLVEAGSVESVRQAAAVGGGRVFPLYAPMLLPDAATVRALSDQRPQRATLDRQRAVTVAMVAVGGWGPGESTVWESLDPDERAATATAGAVGEIGGRLFDAGGAPVAAPLDARVLGVSLADLRSVPHVVVLAHGARRVDAVRGATRSGVVDTLVCDHALATALRAVPGPAGDLPGGPGDATGAAEEVS